MLSLSKLDAKKLKKLSLTAISTHLSLKLTRILLTFHKRNCREIKMLLQLKKNNNLENNQEIIQDLMSEINKLHYLGHFSVKKLNNLQVKIRF